MATEETLLTAVQSLSARLAGIEKSGVRGHPLSALPSELEELAVDTLSDRISHSLAAFERALAECTTAQGSKLSVATEYSRHAASNADSTLLQIQKIRQRHLGRYTLDSKSTPLLAAIRQITSELSLEVFEDGNTITVGGKSFILDIDSIQLKAHFAYGSEAREISEFDTLLSRLIGNGDLSPFASALAEVARLDNIMHQTQVDVFEHMRQVAQQFATPEIATNILNRQLCPLLYERMPFVSFLLDVPRIAAEKLSGGESSLSQITQSSFGCTQAYLEYSESAAAQYFIRFSPAVPITPKTGMAIPQSLEITTKEGFAPTDACNPIYFHDLIISADATDKHLPTDVYEHTFPDGKSTTQRYTLGQNQNPPGFLLDRLPIRDIKNVSSVLEIVNRQLYINRLLRSALNLSKRLPRQPELDIFAAPALPEKAKTRELPKYLDIQLSIAHTTLVFSLSRHGTVHLVRLFVQDNGVINFEADPAGFPVDLEKLTKVAAYGSFPALVRWLEVFS